MYSTQTSIFLHAAQIKDFVRSKELSDVSVVSVPLWVPSWRNMTNAVNSVSVVHIIQYLKTFHISHIVVKS